MARLCVCMTVGMYPRKLVHMCVLFGAIHLDPQWYFWNSIEHSIGTTLSPSRHNWGYVGRLEEGR